MPAEPRYTLDPLRAGPSCLEPPRPDYLGLWSNPLQADGTRLVAFQRWLACELSDRLVWPRDPTAAQRQIGQVRSFIERSVAELGKRGWQFRPDSLREILLEEIDRIATYQRKGGVGDLYAYLRTAWDNWVGRNAEELRAKAERQHVRRGLDPIPKARPMADIVLANLVAKAEEIESGRRLRKAAKQARCSPDATPLLPGLEIRRRA